MRWFGLLLAVFLSGSLLAVPMTLAPASALSCVEVRTVIKNADSVFKGTIVDAEAGRILVNVEEVWRGGPVGRRTWLRVELAEWTEWTEGERAVPDGYSSPATWVFAPHEPHTVNACSAWKLDRHMRRYLLPHRPEHPQQPVVADDATGLPPAADDETTAWRWVGGGTGLAAIGALGFVWWRRRPAS